MQTKRGAAEAAEPVRVGSFVSQSALLAAGGAIAAALAMGYSSLCARSLTPQRFADVTASLSIAVLFSIPTWPLEVAIAQHTSHAYGAGDRARLRAILSRAVRLAAKGSTLCMLAWLIAAPLIRVWLDLDSTFLLVIVGLYVVGTYLACVPRGVLRGDHRFGAFAANQVLEAAVRLAAGTLLLASGFGTVGAMGGYAAAVFGAFAFGQFQLRDLPRADRDMDLSASRTTVGPVLLYHLYAIFCAHIDMLAAKHVLAPHDAGLYGAATTLSRALYLVATPIYQVLLSRVAAMSAAGEATGPVVRRAFLLLCALLCASCIVPLVFGELCLELIFGAAFVGALGPLRALWIAVALFSLQSAIAYVLIASGKAKGFGTLLIPAAILSILLVMNHGDALQVALCTLVGACAGLLWLLGLTLVGRSGTRTAVVGHSGAP